MLSATARACANIALVKYWGKRDAVLNLPAAGSLSLTLAALTTTTTVTWDPTANIDSMTLDGNAASASELARTSAWLDIIRARAKLHARAIIVTRNDFPTASGLASSASGFAALAVAAVSAARISLDDRELSILARQGSGSAARSIFGGLVRMHAGAHKDGGDSYAEPIDSAEDAFVDDLRMIIAIVGGGVPKTHGSRDAMEHCAATSPLYDAWLAQVPRDLAAAEHAIDGSDVVALGEVAEANALAMHATAIAARPAILYWQPSTIALLAMVRALRSDGLIAYATMDAGPHVKVLTCARDADAIAARLRVVDGVSDVLISRAGGATVLLP